MAASIQSAPELFEFPEATLGRSRGLGGLAATQESTGTEVILHLVLQLVGVIANALENAGTGVYRTGREELVVRDLAGALQEACRRHAAKTTGRSARDQARKRISDAQKARWAAQRSGAKSV